MDSNVIIKGIKWASIEFAFGAFFRFAVKLLLAKILLPNDFGLVGMTSIFISVISAASELGMGAALIQKQSNKSAEKLYNTAFWSGLIWGIVLYSLLCIIIGPLTAKFYNEPLLIELIPMLSISILVRPICIVHTVILTRSMNFKKIAIINNISAFIAGIVGIIFALKGFGVWSLAINSFLTAFLAIPLLVFATKWIPKLEWKKLYFQDFFSFGIYSTGTAIFSTITYNIDNLMIGKILGASTLGAYTLAFSLTEVLRQTISSIINKVMYPVFGQKQNDKILLKKYFLTIVNINAIIIYPVMFFFIFFGESVILNIFGSNWNEAIIPLKILSLAMIIHLIINSFTSLLRGLGLPNLEFKIVMGVTIVILIPSLIIGIYYYGLIGASIAILINKSALVVIAIITLKKHLNIKISEIWLSINKVLTALFFSGSISYMIKVNLGIDNLYLILTMYIITYLGCICIVEKNNIKYLLKHIKI